MDQYFYELVMVIFIYSSDCTVDFLYSQAKEKFNAFPVPKWPTLKRQINRYIYTQYF